MNHLIAGPKAISSIWTKKPNCFVSIKRPAIISAYGKDKRLNATHDPQTTGNLIEETRSF